MHLHFAAHLCILLFEVVIVLIDFHTHIFPDKVAPAAIKSLKQGMKDAGNEVYNEHSDGTADGLKRLMKETGVDKSIILPIATKESQTESINAFAKRMKCDEIEPFATVYPLGKNAIDTMERIAEDGFKGIKIHHEFQMLDVDSEQSIRILKKAEELGLMVVIHAGSDIGFSGPVRCTPKKIHNVLGEVSGNNIIAAHLGGFDMWDDVMKYLVGTPIYMDTAFLSLFIDKKMYRDIIKEHGSDKILFGSDNPWENPADTLRALKELKLSDEEYENITFKNATNLLEK